MKITKAQQQALLRVYLRGFVGTYLQFRRTVKVAGTTNDNWLMVPYCGMWLGIEKDGYTHS